jgi:hypothetical protein
MVSCFIRFCRIITPQPPYHQPTLADHPPPSEIRDVHMNVLNHHPCDRLPCRPFISPLSRPFALAPRAPGSPWREHTSLPFDDRVPDPAVLAFYRTSFVATCHANVSTYVALPLLPPPYNHRRRPTTTATSLPSPPSPYYHHCHPTTTAVTFCCSRRVGPQRTLLYPILPRVRLFIVTQCSQFCSETSQC